MTKGEIGFQEFCKTNSVAFERISTSKDKTPDYKLIIRDTMIIAEVKDIEMNEEEKDVQKKMEAGQVRSWGPTQIGARVRDAIGKANRQLRKLTCGKFPGVLVLFDNRPWPFNVVWPYEIKVAMYGFEICDFSVSKGVSPPLLPIMTGRRFGKGRKCSPLYNTSTSTVGVMQSNKPYKGCELVLYHNKHSSVQLSPATFSNIDMVKQFALRPNSSDGFGEWEAI